MPKTVKFAVNGTLMRGLELNGNLQAVGATFVREATTEPTYRLFSINDRYPAMLRVREGGSAIAVEVWEVPVEALSQILLQEPPGLCIGKICLADGEIILGVVGESICCENQSEITQWRGWRAYITSENYNS
ncbi:MULTISPECIES: gamma-glutamylcyclotransferase [unclassified Coleofasciculus]|uniref:allophanate hydrolase-related protein n=1 Tax=unclassified Coleofasciculus TaxID=2692782 RepID=UPI0018812524|nr:MULTISPECIES: gamma-glutamylcyclotransferase [unclassified Coleofasciculus]MBE9125283.1 gamma-glutamylcyclotransferase [Coleofasciculus sp. LEGE 07081]MBE9147064.1 gamma-glutamylcyclotransferase [Coleofasciculus sp. LEGE 07092]